VVAMIQVLLFVLGLLIFLGLLGIIRSNSRAGVEGSGRGLGWEGEAGSAEAKKADEAEHIPALEWEVTEGEALLRQLAAHAKENPAKTSKLIKAWLVEEKDKVNR